MSFLGENLRFPFPLGDGKCGLSSGLLEGFRGWCMEVAPQAVVGEGTPYLHRSPPGEGWPVSVRACGEFRQASPADSVGP